MFTVYGVTGVTFSGTLEEMDRIHALERIQSMPKIARDDSALILELKSNPSQQAAVTAYRRMLPPDIERGPLYHAVQIMQRAVIPLSDSDSLAYSWQILSKNRIHQAPVMDDKSRLIGIVSERDLLTGINIDAGRIVESLSRQVRDVMTSPFDTSPKSATATSNTIPTKYSQGAIVLRRCGGVCATTTRQTIATTRFSACAWSRCAEALTSMTEA